MIELFAQDSPLLSETQHGGAILVAFIIQFLILLTVPGSFNIAGGIVGKVNEFIGGYKGKFIEAIKGNPNDPNSLRNRNRNNLFDKMALSRQDVIKQGENSNASRWQRVRGKIAGSSFFPDARQRVAGVNKRSQEMREQITNYNDDADVYAAGGYRLGRGTTITQDMQRTLLGYDGQPMFSPAQVGTALPEHMNFDAKGRRITNNLYKAGKRLRGRTASQVGEAVGYAFYKGQADRERSAARMAFAYNAHANNWTDETMGDMWAKAVYGKKDIDVTQWYSAPKWGTNPGTGQREVQFKDVSDDLGSFNKMTDELNLSRTSFAITPDRDGAMRTMLDRQREFTAKAQAKGSLTQEEHLALVKTRQIFESVSSEMFKQQPDGSVTAQGTPEAQATIKAAIAEWNASKIELDALQPDGTRTFRLGKTGPVVGVVSSSTGMPAARPAVADAADRPNVARAV